MGFIQGHADLQVLLQGADYVGVTSADAEVRLEEFLGAMFAYRPVLIRRLYRLRGLFVRLIGIRQPPLPPMEEWLPSEVPMLACGNIWFFSVSLTKPEAYWIGCCPHERHLTAYLGVVREPLGADRSRFHFVTIVHFKHWTGRLYFLLIRPINWFFARRLLRAGIACRQDTRKTSGATIRSRRRPTAG
jgi:hypothetical protein